MGNEKVLILNDEQVDQKINRIAHQIYEDNHSEKEIVVVGIANKGFLLAGRIVKKLDEITTSETEISLVKLTLDKKNPIDNKGVIDIEPSKLDNKVIILVDDVLNSGKTLIYGVKYLLNFPIKKMSTVVLVDRNHKRYPIGTHYVGLSLSTTLQDHISVIFDDTKICAFLD